MWRVPRPDVSFCRVMFLHGNGYRYLCRRYAAQFLGTILPSNSFTRPFRVRALVVSADRAHRQPRRMSKNAADSSQYHGRRAMFAEPARPKPIYRVLTVENAGEGLR